MSILRSILHATLALSFTAANASPVNEPVHGLEERSPWYGGIWLQLPLTEHGPPGTITCSTQIDGTTGPCCPAGTHCPQLGEICCPTTEDCSAAVDANPTCADPSWVLWGNGGTGKSLDAYCCPAGRVVDLKQECVAPGGSGTAAQDPSFTSMTQANNAPPPSAGATGGSSTTTVTGSSAIAAASSATTVAASKTTAVSTAAGSTGTQTSSQTAATSTSRTSGADRIPVSGGYLAWMTVFLVLLS